MLSYIRRTKISRILPAIALLLIAGTNAFAQPADPVRDKLKADLNRSGLAVQSVQATPAAGVYEVVAKDQVYFIFASRDGESYYLTDQLTDLNTGRDLGASTRQGIRQKILDDIGESRMLVYGPETAEHTITVFTDSTCGYCRLLHQQMADYNEKGIRIRYLLYPRAGKESDAYKTLVSIWCSNDRNNAMDRAKSQLPVEQNLCEDHPVDRHFSAGQRLSLRGTPHIVTESGDVISGYMPPEALRERLDQLAAR